MTQSAKLLFSIRPLEGDDLVLFAMVRPEVRAIECQRAGCEGNSDKILDPRRIGTSVHAREPVVVRFLGVGRDEIGKVANNNLPADAMSDIDDPLHISVLAQREHFLGIPLAHMQALPVPTEL